MNILAIDPGAAMLALVLRWQDEGHAVRWWLRPRKDGTESKVGDGLATKVKDWQPSMKWADLVVVGDNTYGMRLLEGYRKGGFPILGPNVAGAELELDRRAGQQLWKRCGVETLPYEMFTRAADAERFVKREGGRWVSKPNADDNKAMSYLADSPADMVYMLQRWKSMGKLKGEFMFQKFVKGYEMAVGGWIGPYGFLPFWCENFEHKKLMPGNKGPNTGEMATILKYTMDSALAEQMLKPCEAELVARGITGYVDANCIIDEETGQPYPLEWTVRFGYPTIQIQMTLDRGDMGEWMGGLVDGHNRTDFDTANIATGLVLAIPDFPYSHVTKKEVEGVPIYGLDKVRADVRLCECMLGDAPTMDGEKVVEERMVVTAGDYVLQACGAGVGVGDSAKAAYKTVKALSMPASPLYRDDIGEEVRKNLPKLQAFGFCESWKE